MTSDDELIQIFISEAKDILENINQQLDKLRQNLLQKEPWAVILRELHTLKGSARMLALLDLNAYTHLLEEVVKKLYQQDTFPLDEHMNALQHAFDYMNYYIEELSKANILPRNESFFSKYDKYWFLMKKKTHRTLFWKILINQFP